MRRVMILSPFSGQQRKNTEYARRAMADSVRRGEAPFASHLLLPQILSEKPRDREIGMACGHAWIQVADAVVVYGDLGMSSDMMDDIAVAREAGLEVEMRMLGKTKGRPRKKRTKAKDEPEAKDEPKAKPAKKKAAKKPAGDGAPGKRRTRDQLRLEALTLIGSKDGGLTKTQLREQLHCSGATLGRVLDALVADGRAELKGTGRKAVYRRAAGPTTGVQSAVDEVVG